MSVPIEFWLVLGIVGFYLYDSLVTLQPGELVLRESGGRWNFFVPASDWQFGGKYVYLPNPLLPVQTLYRLNWHIPEAARVDTDAMRAFLHAQRFLRPVVVVLFALLLIVLPFAICRLATIRVLLALVAETYLFLVASAILLVRQRAALRLDPKAAAKLALDGLMCAPFSLNLIRKLGLGYRWQGDPVLFARDVLKPERFAELRETLMRRIDRDLEMTDEGESMHETLQQARRRFSDMAA